MLGETYTEWNDCQLQLWKLNKHTMMIYIVCLLRIVQYCYGQVAFISFPNTKLLLNCVKAWF